MIRRLVADGVPRRQIARDSCGWARAPPVHPCQRNRVPCSGERACSPSRTRPIKASDSRSLRIHADSLLRSPEFCAHTCVRCGILLVSAGFLQIQALSLRLSAESTTVCELVHRSRCTNSHTAGVERSVAALEGGVRAMEVGWGSEEVRSGSARDRSRLEIGGGARGECARWKSAGDRRRGAAGVRAMGVAVRWR